MKDTERRENTIQYATDVASSLGLRDERVNKKTKTHDINEEKKEQLDRMWLRPSNWQSALTYMKQFHLWAIRVWQK